MHQLTLIVGKSDSDPWGTIVAFLIVGGLWLAGTVSTKLSQRKNKPRKPFTPTFQPPQVVRPQALEAQPFSGGKQRVVAAPKGRPPPLPGRVAVKVPLKGPAPAAKKPKPARKSAPPPMPPATTPAAIPGSAAQAIGAIAGGLTSTAAKTRDGAVPGRAILSKRLVADDLRAQFILTELLRPPVALRDPEVGPSGA